MTHRPDHVSGKKATLAGRLLRNRRLVRAPIALYRARLGFLFGHRMLMLEHTGRVSGRPRRVVLEVVQNPAPGVYVVASGFGTRAQWFRNVLHDPHVRVATGWGGPHPAVATPMEPEAAARSLQKYASRHPRAWRRLRPVFEETLGATIDTKGTSLPLVRLVLAANDSAAAR